MATKARDTLLTPKAKSKKEFIDAMISDSVSFGWGAVINSIPYGDGTNTGSILRDIQKVTIADVRKYTSQFLYQPNSNDVPPEDYDMSVFPILPDQNPNEKDIFYARVRINMIGERIWNSLSSQGQSTLQNHAKKYLWKTNNGEQMYDGPTMLKILVTSVNPSSMVGVTNLKEKLRSVTLSGFQHNVVEMFDHQVRIYQEIKQLGKSHEDIVFDTFRALSSTTNSEFDSFVKDLKNYWETNDGQDTLTYEELVEKCTAKYNNLVHQKTWKSVDVKDAKLVALATQVKSLEDKLSKRNNGAGGSDNSNNGGKDNKNKSSKIAEWRTCKTLGDSVKKDGTQWYWCPHQHNNGKGLYVTHKPEDHTEWKNNPKQWLKKRSGQEKSTNSGGDKTLKLNDKLKAALVTKFKCSDAEAKQLIDSIGDESQSGN